jgi:hypothetical protein
VVLPSCRRPDADGGLCSGVVPEYRYPAECRKPGRSGRRTARARKRSGPQAGAVSVTCEGRASR